MSNCAPPTSAASCLPTSAIAGATFFAGALNEAREGRVKQTVDDLAPNDLKGRIAPTRSGIAARSGGATGGLGGCRRAWLFRKHATTAWASGGGRKTYNGIYPKKTRHAEFRNVIRQTTLETSEELSARFLRIDKHPAYDVTPASTASIWPVIMLASSEAKNTKVRATSSTVGARPRGNCAAY